MDFPYDVTVSVWNEFWAPELCDGLARAGLNVLALRSEGAPYPGVVSRCSQRARVLTRLFQKTHWHPLLESAQDIFEAFAVRRVGQSPVFWGWNGHNLDAFRAARERHQRVICERGSTHGAWSSRRLNKVHSDLGWGPTDIDIHPREQRAIEEYSVAERIMVPSKFVLKTFLEEGVAAEKLHVNPYGVDLDRWSKIRGTRRTEGPLVFAFTASLTPRKGVHTLLRAWHKAGLEDAELWMCGGVHFPIEKLGIPVDRSVKFLGYQRHAQLEDIYDRASVYVLPSFEEGMARSGIEAFAAGLPAIVTEETGLTDLMATGEEGWVVSSGEADQLADVLRAAAASRHDLPARARAARRCTERASKKNYGDRAAKFLEDFLAGEA